MNMTLKLITPAATLPVTVAEAKAHSRIDISDDDALLGAMLSAATDMAEQYTGRSLITQTWDMTLDAFPTEFELTRAPVASITAITYTDTAGTTQTLASTDYVLVLDDFRLAKVVPAYGVTWPTARSNVTVRYVAGYTNAAAVPEAIKAWIKLMVSTMYENRETEAYSSRAVSTTVQMRFVDGLLDKYKVFA